MIKPVMIVVWPGEYLLIGKAGAKAPPLSTYLLLKVRICFCVPISNIYGFLVNLLPSHSLIYWDSKLLYTPSSWAREEEEAAQKRVYENYSPL